MALGLVPSFSNPSGSCDGEMEPGMLLLSGSTEEAYHRDDRGVDEEGATADGSLDNGAVARRTVVRRNVGRINMIVMSSDTQKLASATLSPTGLHILRNSGVESDQKK